MTPRASEWGENAMGRHRFVLIVVAAVGLFAFASPASAATPPSPFTIVSQSAQVERHRATVTFTVVFNENPNFWSTDAVGRQQDSFQYFIVGDPSLSYPANFDSIIRGEEIHFTQTSIRIRNAYPPDSSDPTAGWGAIRGTVPFTLDGPVLTFTVPLRVISNHLDGTTLSYRLESYEFGGITSSVQASIPLAGTCGGNHGRERHTRRDGIDDPNRDPSREPGESRWPRHA